MLHSHESGDGAKGERWIAISVCVSFHTALEVSVLSR